MTTDNNIFPSETWFLETSCGKFYLTIAFDQSRKKIVRVLISAGKAGGCASATLVPLVGRISDIIENSSLADRILAYTEMTSIKCHQPDNCTALIAQKVLEIELKLSERREKK
jgi:hypothetical protein